MNMTKKQIDIIISNTPRVLKGKQSRDYSWVATLGYYQKPYANWSYSVELRLFKGVPTPVVVVFGEIQ